MRGCRGGVAALTEWGENYSSLQIGANQGSRQQQNRSKMRGGLLLRGLWVNKKLFIYTSYIKQSGNNIPIYVLRHFFFGIVIITFHIFQDNTDSKYSFTDESLMVKTYISMNLIKSSLLFIFPNISMCFSIVTPANCIFSIISHPTRYRLPFLQFQKEKAPS